MRLTFHDILIYTKIAKIFLYNVKIVNQSLKLIM